MGEYRAKNQVHFFFRGFQTRACAVLPLLAVIPGFRLVYYFPSERPTIQPFQRSLSSPPLTYPGRAAAQLGPTVITPFVRHLCTYA